MNLMMLLNLLLLLLLGALLLPKIFDAFGSMSNQQIDDLLFIGTLGNDNWCLLLLILMVDVCSMLDQEIYSFKLASTNCVVDGGLAVMINEVAVSSIVS